MEKNNSKSIRKNSPQGQISGGQPVPLSGSHKVKNKNHSRQKNQAHHDM